MKNRPKISIIIPVYNAKEYLGVCLDSVINQSVVDIEVVIINDGSTDGSDIFCDNYKNNDSRIQVIHKDNGGVGLARKIGIESSSGDYIMFVDSDDYLEENALSSLLENSNDNSIDVIMGDFNLVSNKSICRTSRVIKGKDDYIKKIIEWGSIETVLWAKLIKRDLFERSGINFYEGLDFGEDYAILPRLFYFSNNIVKIDKVVYNYRKGVEGSYTNSLNDKKCEDLLKANSIVSEFYEKLPDYSKYYSSVGIGKLNIRCFLFFYDKKNKQFKNLQEFYKYYSIGDIILFKILDLGLIKLATFYNKVYSKFK